VRAHPGRAVNVARMSNPNPKLRKARERIASVFTYLQELHRVRTPPTVDLDDYAWRLALGQLPTSPTIERLGLFAGAGAAVPHGEDSPGSLLRVARPREAPCPPPPDVLVRWLPTAWPQPIPLPELEAQLARPEKADGHALLTADQADAAAEWVAQRHRWVGERTSAEDALAIFLELFKLWTQFEREGEKFQLYLGDGILVHKGAGFRVRHPVLLQRLELKFNPSVPAFTITESDDNPELYSPLLRHLLVDGKSLLQMQQAFAEQLHHPLGGEATSRFLASVVHGFWPDGAYYESAEQAAAHSRGPCIYRDPTIYLGHRSQDFADAIDRYLERLAGKEEPPEALLRVVGIANARATTSNSDADIDLLLTQPTNPEQEQVIRRIEETGAVLVQGPPGTGKSHTIANLIGHLLAEKKSILVTSHASKALRVVREKVAPPLQSLCVSVLDTDGDSAKQLEESITGILNYFSTTSLRKLRKEIEAVAEERTQLKERIADLKERLLSALAEEATEIEFAGERLSAADAARRLAATAATDGWLPGPVSEDCELPLSAADRAELAELYELSAKTAGQVQPAGAGRLPDPSALPTPPQFNQACNEMTKLALLDIRTGAEYWRHDRQTAEQLEQLSQRVTAAAQIFEDPQPWLFECVAAGHRGREAREQWAQLVRSIRDLNQQIPPRKELVLQYGPQLALDGTVADAVQTCSEIVDHVSSGKKMKRVSTLFKSQWQSFMRAAQVDDGPPTTVEHFRALLDMLEIRSLRENLCRRWDRQMATAGAPSSTALGHEPEVEAAPYAERMASALDWTGEHLGPLEQEFERVGLNWTRLLKETAVDAEQHRDIRTFQQLLGARIPDIIAARARYVRWQQHRADRERWLAYLRGLEAEGDADRLVVTLRTAVEGGVRDAFSSAFAQLEYRVRVNPNLQRRDELLEQLAVVAPSWAAAIRHREPPHDGPTPPGDPEAGLRYRLWSQRVSALGNVDLDQLQRELNRATERLHELTARYVEKLAWEAQFERTGLEQQQALAGWLALHKKIGKGAGKNVTRLKREANNTLSKCRQAVPVWIMPLSRVVESFDIATTQFDVVILDEASQCDILGLVAFALAREVAVVGDHEQVSPYAVGHKTEKIQGLIDELLADIPNRQLYDGKTSVYDLARQSFGGTIRLLEHFRCVPDIIQFSNRLCYNGDIRPLREASSARVTPHLVVHKVAGKAVNKVNKEEAIEIACLVAAICDLPEYDGCTIGVICMVGTEQALRIDSLLRRRLKVAEYQRRRLLCGNASQFQGDERDVILLSMVDSSTGKKLPIRQRDDAKKVFNVAASRARDQLWVVHSLNPARDLKAGDFRLQLINHASNPAALRDQLAEDLTLTPSAMEHSLATALQRLDYRVSLYPKIGEYTVPIIVEGEGQVRVAIQCDGARPQDRDQLLEAVARQSTLERLGWRFIRVRATAYYAAPDRVVDRVCRRLDELGIKPIGALPALQPPHGQPAAADSPLHQRVLELAARLRSEGFPDS
jgi:very-short-patch-repair endonuclease